MVLERSLGLKKAWLEGPLLTTRLQFRGRKLYLLYVNFVKEPQHLLNQWPWLKAV